MKNRTPGSWTAGAAEPRFVRAGVQPVLLDTTVQEAYVSPVEDDTTTAVLDIGDTTAVVTGPFGKSELPVIVRNLLPR